MAAQAVEKIAEGVEKVAEGVDKAAEDLKERLPDGRLKQVVSLVEHLAEETAEEAEKVVHLMDKVISFLINSNFNYYARLILTPNL